MNIFLSGRTGDGHKFTSFPRGEAGTRVSLRFRLAVGSPRQATELLGNRGGELESTCDGVSRGLCVCWW